jgi:1-deoxy-D-xylulose-5-phosphate synthase
VRYPRGSGPNVAINPTMQALPIGRAELRREGSGVAILAFGSLLTPALAAGDRLDATVVNMRFVKPLDEAMIERLARTHDLIVTVEENAIAGGAGGAVNEHLARVGLGVPIVNLGLPDQFIEHGDPKQLLAECGLDADGIHRSILRHRPPGVAGILESA